MTIHLGRSLPNASRDLPGPDARTRLLMHGSLFGLAPGGVYPATTVTGSAVRSYRTLSPLPRNIRPKTNNAGGLLSVALSLGSPPPGVTRHRIPVEPGLSSLWRFRGPKRSHPAIWHALNVGRKG